MEMTKVTFDAAFETEVAMANADRVVKETADMRNELESYVYDMRDKIISESQLKPFCTPAEVTSLSASLETCENWLYEDGFDAVKSVYAEELSKLKKIGDPIEYRMRESGSRPNAFEVLKRTLEKYKNWLNSAQGDDKYAHITEEETAKCHKKSDEVLSWMYDMLDKQGSLAANANPVVSTAEINAKSKEVTNVISPIMHKPVPKPKVVEPPKQEPTPKKEEKKDDTPAPMETDETKKEETTPMDTSA